MFYNAIRRLDLVFKKTLFKMLFISNTRNFVSCQVARNAEASVT